MIVMQRRVVTVVFTTVFIYLYMYMTHSVLIKAAPQGINLRGDCRWRRYA